MLAAGEARAVRSLWLDRWALQISDHAASGYDSAESSSLSSWTNTTP